MISQEDKIILKREKYGGLYKLKGKKNSIRDGVSRISLKGSSLRGGVSKKTVIGREPGQSVIEKRNSAFWQGPRWPKPWR